jgi:hypothetical protein
MKKRANLFIKCLSFVISSILFFSCFSLAYNVKLGWESNTESDLKGYKLYSRVGDSDPPYNQIDTYPEEELLDPLQPMVEVADLENDVTYYFAVTAYDIFGLESEYSNAIWVKNGEWGNVQPVVNRSIETDSDGGGGGGGGGACFIAKAAEDFNPLSLLVLLCILAFVGVVVGKGIK